MFEKFKTKKPSLPIFLSRWVNKIIYKVLRVIIIPNGQSSNLFRKSECKCMRVLFNEFQILNYVCATCLFDSVRMSNNLLLSTEDIGPQAALVLGQSYYPELRLRSRILWTVGTHLVTGDHGNPPRRICLRAVVQLKFWCPSSAFAHINRCR